ncbi:MAG TPA: hypothetical protein VLI69_00550 [Gammaproteobacteria bacterium]|nr:hypothetical protein [Gammaproteobacteria bacterium]
MFSAKKNDKDIELNVIDHYGNVEEKALEAAALKDAKKNAELVTMCTQRGDLDKADHLVERGAEPSIEYLRAKIIRAKTLDELQNLYDKFSTHPSLENQFKASKLGVFSFMVKDIYIFDKVEFITRLQAKVINKHAATFTAGDADFVSKKDKLFSGIFHQAHIGNGVKRDHYDRLNEIYANLAISRKPAQSSNG